MGKVPLCFMEREANELRRKRQPVAKSIVEVSCEHRFGVHLFCDGDILFYIYGAGYWKSISSVRQPNTRGSVLSAKLFMCDI